MRNFNHIISTMVYIKDIIVYNATFVQYSWDVKQGYITDVQEVLSIII